MTEESRRNGWQVMGDFLREAEWGAKKTEMVYKANSNFEELGRYMRKALALGLVEKDGKKFKTTDKGKRFIIHVFSLEALLNG